MWIFMKAIVPDLKKQGRDSKYMISLVLRNMLVLELHLHLQQLFANLLRVIIIAHADQFQRCLFGLECMELRNKDVQERLSEIESFMMDYYDDIRKQVKETEVKNKLSTTLITKILMGTFGCVYIPQLAR